MPPRNNSPGFEISLVTCSTDFFDSGGPNPYGNNENGILTFCPETAGDRIRIDFIAADIKSGDFLKVYDGDSVDAPLLLTINNITALDFERTLVKASQGNPQGCLTVTFTSIMMSVPNPYEGWFASVSCFTPVIEPGEPQDLFRNDDPSGDEIETFDLTENDGAILNGLSPFEFEVTYYSNEADASSGFNPLDPMHSNTTNPQPIYCRLENPTTGYSAIDNFLIYVNRIPDIFPVSDLIACDSDSDGAVSFRLSDRHESIFNGRESLEVLFYSSSDDAINNRNILNSETYNSTGVPEIIYYRLIDTETGAYSIGEFSIQVIASPILNSVSEVLACGAGNGTAEIDLNSISEQLTEGQLDLQLTWHSSQEDAESGLNPIPNILSLGQSTSLFVRASSAENDCPAIAEIPFIFYTQPEISLKSEYYICPNTSNQVVFLETGLSENDYSFSWLFNDVQISSADEPFLMTDQIGRYDVLIEDFRTGCIFTNTVEVVLASPPSDLEILTMPTQFGSNYQVTVNTSGSLIYSFSLDGGPFRASPIFENVLPGSHRLEITLEGGCEVLTTTFVILGYPTFFTPNGDNINETWSVSRAPGITDMTVYIFNRLGVLITVLTENQPEWNGSWNGRDLPSDTYWFQVEYKEDDTPKIANGYFTLRR
ncbi:T9SS type B sorting domain-containing protein [Muriicola sp. SD30]|uniref:T9SS type B sorting domain-containing protein n=1 Tax=Muriicola sp. SD30 TaxID=3240936 RepID=UPI00350EDE37